MKNTVLFFVLAFISLISLLLIPREITASSDAIIPRQYLPLVIKGGEGSEVLSLLSTGGNYSDVVAGNTVDRTEVATTYTQPRNNEGYYLMGRTYVEFYINGSYRNPVLDAYCTFQSSRSNITPQIRIRWGRWSGRLASVNEVTLWQSSYGSQIATASASDCQNGRIHIPLPIGTASGLLKLVVVDVDDYRDMRPYWGTGDYRTFTLEQIILSGN